MATRNNIEKLAKKLVNRKKGRIRYYTFSTRLKYNERNELLTWCRVFKITPSEFIRECLLKKFEEEKNGVKQ